MAIAVDSPEQVRRQLRRWLGTKLAAQTGVPPDSVDVSPIGTPTSGSSNETAFFTATWEESGVRQRADYVVRRQAQSNQVFLDTDVIREARVLAALEGSGVPVPRVLATETDPSVLQVPFFVMERVEGKAPFALPSIHAAGWLPTLTTAERRRLWDSALGAVVAIHRVDWRGGHEFLAARIPGPPCLSAHLARIAAWYGWATGGKSYPTTDAALEYLTSHQSSVGEGEPVLLWGDARIGNMLFGDDLSVAAVIDWELATVGPPEIDVGWWLMMDHLLTEASGVERLAGFPDRQTTIDEYETRSGRSLKDLHYYQVLGALTMATTVIRFEHIGIEQGRLDPTTRMGHGNIATRLLARYLDLPVPKLDPDYAARRQLPIE
jgi:aminoglycoside phosphotransferase (APT) family kinase protein